MASGFFLPLFLSSKVGECLIGLCNPHLAGPLRVLGWLRVLLSILSAPEETRARKERSTKETSCLAKSRSWWESIFSRLQLRPRAAAYSIPSTVFFSHTSAESLVQRRKSCFVKFCSHSSRWNDFALQDDYSSSLAWFVLTSSPRLFSLLFERVYFCERAVHFTRIS